MPAPATSRPRHGGIRKHQQRRDRDGDLVMGAAPRVASTRSAHRNNNTHTPKTPASSPFTELKVTGWTDEKEMPKLLGFLERHSARRSPNTSKGGVPPKMIKRHRVSGDTLTIFVRPEDVTAFSKINGFTFASAHGHQKLTIIGPGIRSKSPTTGAQPAADGNRPAKGNERTETTNTTVDLLKGFLERRYNLEAKLLNLSNIADDEEVAKSGMFNTKTTQLKFFPALMVVCDQTLKTAEEKREAIHSVTLSGNNLPNLDVVKDLASTLPQIKNLDLSGNKFETHNALKPWKNRFRNLEHLIIDPFATDGWEEDVTAWFPKLRVLNDKQVRTEFSPEQEAMITYVQEQTKLKRDMAVQCLQAGDWNIEKAAELFQKTTLPPDAFN